MGNTNTIIIMQGGPATGKTTLGKRLAASLELPYFSKDGVKEPIFDHVGCPTEWETDHPLSGRKMDDAANAILFYLMETQLQAGCDCVIDSTFAAQHVPALLALKSRNPFTPIQILCRADAAELTRRHRRRAEGGERHPGHLDQRISDAFDAAAEIDRKLGAVGVPQTPLCRPFLCFCTLGNRLQPRITPVVGERKAYPFIGFLKLTHCSKFTRIFEEQLVAASMKSSYP
jgi:predicted kinase